MCKERGPRGRAPSILHYSWRETYFAGIRNIRHYRARIWSFAIVIWPSLKIIAPPSFPYQVANPNIFTARPRSHFHIGFEEGSSFFDRYFFRFFIISVHSKFSSNSRLSILKYVNPEAGTGKSLIPITFF